MNNTHCVGCDVEFSDEVRAETRPGEEDTCGMDSCKEIAHLRSQLRDAKAAALRQERSARGFQNVLRDLWEPRPVDADVRRRVAPAVDQLLTFVEQTFEFAPPEERYQVYLVVAEFVQDELASARVGMEFAEAA